MQKFVAEMFANPQAGHLSPSHLSEAWGPTECINRETFLYISVECFVCNFLELQAPLEARILEGGGSV